MHYKAILVLAIAGTVSARSVHHKKHGTVSARSVHHKRQATPALPAGWTAVGCYVDSWDRTLTTQLSASNQLTTESCLTACNGYIYAGTENGNECYCSNTLAPTGTKAADSDCSISCSGGAGELCGGQWRLSVYQYTAATWPDPPFIPFLYPPSGWLNAGCYSDNYVRTLSDQVSVSGPFSRASCIAACDSAGYTYAGVEDGNECYCSNTVAPTGVITSDEECSIPCAGDSTLSCGGGWRINIFQREGKGTLFYPLGGWTSLGCYTDDSLNRTLSGPSYTSNDPNVILSNADCQRYCSIEGYKYAGAENGNECICGHSIATTGVRAPNEDCLTPCSVKSPEGLFFCGGPSRLSIYHGNYN